VPHPARALAALLLLAAAPGARAAEEAAWDRDFEPLPSRHSLALGPVTPGELVPSMEVGWLRSGLRVDLGMGLDFDLFVRLEGFLLHSGLKGQNVGAAGLRFSPVKEGPFRLSVALELGGIFLTSGRSTVDLAAVRGELTAGFVPFDDWLAYGRLSLRGVSTSRGVQGAWGRDEEFGAGLERVLFQRLVVAGEFYTWAREGQPGLGQWRVRVGYAH
jgi:hypothetical protein